MTPDKKTHNNGLNAEGYIINPCCTDIQSAYRQRAETVQSTLISLMPDRLHSLYLYGSVARGTAIKGVSDLDVVILFKKKPSCEEKERLKRLETELNINTDTPVGFDIGSIEEVQGENQALFWQFFIKHCCSCIYGEDISRDFPHVKTSKELARSLNSELQNKLNILFADTTPENRQDNVKSIAKQLIRSAYFLIIEKDKSFFSDLDSCAAAFLEHHPEKETTITTLKKFIINDNNSISELRSVADDFGGWIDNYFETNA